MKDVGRTFVTGDVHGRPAKLSGNNWPLGKELTKKDVVIILGDFGLLWSEYRTKEEDYWLKFLDDRPFTTCFIDGNHENFSILNNLPKKMRFGSEVGVAGHSIFHLKRGNCYRINDLKILAIGGAHSHDREYRVWGKTMWREEEITDEDIQKAKDSLVLCSFQVDYILTHCAPEKKAHGCMQQSMAHLWTPDRSEEKLQEILDYKAFYRRWYCGHYHTDYGPTYDGKFECIYNKIIELTGEDNG